MKWDGIEVLDQKPPPARRMPLPVFLAELAFPNSPPSPVVNKGKAFSVGFLHCANLYSTTETQCKVHQRKANVSRDQSQGHVDAMGYSISTTKPQ